MKPDTSPPVEGQVNAENLSLDAFIASRLQDQNPAEETETEEAEESEAEEETEEVDGEDAIETGESEVDESEESEDEESEAEQGDEIDLLALEPEQIQELAKKGKSRLLKDVGKLRAENRMLEERLASLESQGQKPTKEIPTDANPFGNLNTVEEVQGKFDELEATLETTDRLLEEYEDYGPDDVIEVGKQQFTKKQIRIANRNAREAITKYLPAQQKHIAKLAQLENASKQYRAQAEKEVPEIKDEKSEVGQLFKVLVNDPLVKQVKEKLPELGFQMEYILAHAVRSIKGKTSKIPQGAGSKLKVKLPASPVSSAAGSKTSSQKSKVQAAYARYEKTGSAADYQAYRLAQMGQ